MIGIASIRQLAQRFGLAFRRGIDKTRRSVAPSAAKFRLVQIADEIIALLNSDPNASVKINVEISADFPDGATDQIKRAVSENAKSLNFGSAEWE